MRALFAAAFLMTSVAAQAQSPSPVGVWQSIDDETGRPTALIRIAESGGTLSGRIEQLFRKPDEDQNPLCNACTDARKGQPIRGMTIVQGLRPAADGDGWEGGEILDPANGKTYKSTLRLTDGGNKVVVRGYIGAPMFGRSQTWVRQ
ncbi:DUF2147 domain-containing protein [Achromobacter sp. GG226]|uniref:DUF2147 domain-containing protein n=1 Tax=Verticiella alkaliphila TaxID=2779529 RepID=UPI001C0DA999|nr:DUF2147 domain-containing protein [Verticiella sp. GG226]MBU4609506.1 DUF2147 domain-containing protein [Verticiella sp. GG226]